jgi:hypothetical protein
LADETKGRPRKRLNASEKRERRAASWQLFVKRIGRKAQRGVEPNDRKHSVKMDRRDGFAEGNIIHHVIVTTKAKPSITALRKLLGEPHQSVGEPHRGQNEAWIARCEQSVVDGDLKFFELQPSYGCEILALCENVKVEAVACSDDPKSS